jgi:hypothetical protein
MLFDLGCDDGLTLVHAVPEDAVPEGTRAGWGLNYQNESFQTAFE